MKVQIIRPLPGVLSAFRKIVLHDLEKMYIMYIKNGIQNTQGMICKSKQSSRQETRPIYVSVIQSIFSCTETYISLYCMVQRLWPKFKDFCPAIKLNKYLSWSLSNMK